VKLRPVPPKHRLPHALRDAAAALCLAAGVVSPASALGLGSARVLSSIGQPLRADIALRDLGANDVDTLKVVVASPSAYAARQLIYSGQLEQLRIRVVPAADGSAVLQLRGTRAVDEPFVDVLLRATWAGGEITRDYTLLFDPPGFHEPAAAAAIAPQAAAPAPAPTAPHKSATTVQPRRRATAAATPSGTVPASYRVRPGDTLSGIARRLGVEQVSLDQMLVALYRANSGAFIGHNMNLLRAGSVLQVPDAASAAAVSATVARRQVIAQSRDFGAYRRRLAQVAAQGAPHAAESPRSSSGRIEAEVSAPRAAESQPQSRLKLSKPNEGGEQAAEASRIAAQRQAEALQARLAAARASVAELSRLAASAAQAAAAATPAAPMPAVPTASVTAASAPAAAAAVSSKPAEAKPAEAKRAPERAQAPAAKPAEHGVIAPAVPAKPAAPRATPSLSWADTLLANPLLLPGAAGVLALLGLLLWLRRRAGAKSRRDNSVFDSRMTAADSFFGGSGGERVDTRNSTLGSSIAYSPSQLDSGDVDPVAEADVYLAYGRDLQAEEILKESLKTHPERNAARLKLLEIYARRKDVRSFEMTAAELFTLTEGTGPDWKKAQDLGRNLDPVNPLYHNTQPPSSLNSPSTVPLGDLEPGASTLDVPAATLPATELMSAPTPGAARAVRAEVPEAGATRPMHGLDLDLDLSAEAAASALELPQRSAAATPATADELEPVTMAPAEAHDDAAHAPLEFDFSGLSLDLAPPAVAQAEALPRAAGDLDDAFELFAPGDAADTVDTLLPVDEAAPAAPEAATAPVPAAEAAAGVAERAAGAEAAPPLHFELELPPVHETPVAAPEAAAPAAAAAAEATAADAAEAAEAAEAAAPVSAEAAPAEVVDTRFALVDECRAIGDVEMARDLLREIVAEGDTASRERAEAMLAELG
jgi:pilus assembly protein FimV